MAIAEHTLDLLVRRLGLHARLTAEDRAALLALPFVLRTTGPSAYLVREGQPSESCAVLVAGFAYRQKLTEQGARQIVGIHIPGEPLDFQNLFLDVADHDLLTLTKAQVAIIPREAVRAIARERPNVAHAILIYTLIEGSIFREWILNVGRRDAKASVAHLLCEFAIRMDVLGVKTGAPYDFPMTQEQIGDCLGLTPVHVSRTLRALAADGLITRVRRQISFPSWPVMRRAASFDAGYLHLSEQRS